MELNTNSLEMKTFKLLICTCLAVFALGCSTSDDSDNNNDPGLMGNYFPSTQGDFWIYNVVNTDMNVPEGNFTATDLVTVETSTGNSFTVSINNNSTPPSGSFNALLDNGTMTRTDDRLTFSGTLALPEELETIFSQSIVLNNLVLYDLNADDNAELSSFSDTISEDLQLGADTFPLTVNYEFVSIKSGYTASETVDGETYNNVVKTRLVLTLDASTQVEVAGIPVNYSILNSQEVLTMDVWYAENVGLIKAYSESTYQISQQIIDLLAILQVDLGFPENNTSTNNQELDSYIVASN